MAFRKMLIAIRGFVIGNYTIKRKQMLKNHHENNVLTVMGTYIIANALWYETEKFVISSNIIINQIMKIVINSSALSNNGRRREAVKLARASRVIKASWRQQLSLAVEINSGDYDLMPICSINIALWKWKMRMEYVIGLWRPAISI